MAHALTDIAYETPQAIADCVHVELIIYNLLGHKILRVLRFSENYHTKLFP